MYTSNSYRCLFQAGDASIIDVDEAGIYDMFLVKQSAIKLACDAAVTILRVDQVLKHCTLEL